VLKQESEWARKHRSWRWRRRSCWRRWSWW